MLAKSELKAYQLYNRLYIAINGPVIDPLSQSTIDELLLITKHQ